MSIEYWESAVDEIMHSNGIELTVEQISKLAIDFNDASDGLSQCSAPVYSSINTVKTIEILPKSACCDAEIIGKTTGMLNGHYNACSRCETIINVNF